MPNQKLYHPLTSRPYPTDYFDSETVETLLLLADSSVPRETIEGWNDQERAAAGNWALRSHLHASDNYRIKVPMKPAHVETGEEHYAA